METSADQMARRLAQAHQARAPYVDVLAGRGDAVDLAYAIQDRLISLRREVDGGAIVGWKIGMTTAPMQALTGMAEPASGAILAAGRRASGDVIEASAFVHLGLEGELAVQLAEAFTETEAIDPARVLARLESVAAAFEVTDDRNADWSSLDGPSLVADNIWNAGVVIGPPAPARTLGRLVGLRGDLVVNGRLREQGMSQDIGCDPLEIIAWLGAHLARRGQPLQPGQLIMTGSFVSTTFPRPGDRYSFAVEGLEPVQTLVA